MTEHAGIAPALVAALSELVSVEKHKSAKIEMKGGGSYSYDYADLSDCVKATRPVLARHGIVALTSVHGHEQGLACTVELVHESGESKKFDPLPFPQGRDAQATGSAITYHRRYALLAALGMAADDDDDGAKASAPPPPVASAAQVKAINGLAQKIGDDATTVVPSVIEEIAGRACKSRELTPEEARQVIEELGRVVERYTSVNGPEVKERTEAGEEPFLDERPFTEDPA